MAQARRFPWVLLLILLVTVYLFWIFPLQKPAGAIQVNTSTSAR